MLSLQNTAMASKRKIKQWGGRDIPVLWNSARWQWCIEFCLTNRDILEQECTAGSGLLGTWRGT